MIMVAEPSQHSNRSDIWKETCKFYKRGKGILALPYTIGNRN